MSSREVISKGANLEDWFREQSQNLVRPLAPRLDKSEG